MCVHHITLSDDALPLAEEVKTEQRCHFPSILAARVGRTPGRGGRRRRRRMRGRAQLPLGVIHIAQPQGAGKRKRAPCGGSAAAAVGWRGCGRGCRGAKRNPRGPARVVRGEWLYQHTKAMHTPLSSLHCRERSQQPHPQLSVVVSPRPSISCSGQPLPAPRRRELRAQRRIHQRRRRAFASVVHCALGDFVCPLRKASLSLYPASVLHAGREGELRDHNTGQAHYGRAGGKGRVCSHAGERAIVGSRSFFSAVGRALIISH